MVAKRCYGSRVRVDDDGCDDEQCRVMVRLISIDKHCGVGGGA